jgi:hypothetical protein
MGGPLRRFVCTDCQSEAAIARGAGSYRLLFRRLGSRHESGAVGARTAGDETHQPCYAR